MGRLYNILNKMIDKTPSFDFSHAYASGGSYTKTIASFPAGYLAANVDLGTAPANKRPLFLGFDIEGGGTSKVYVLGLRIYREADDHWTFFIKMTNTSSAITNTTIRVYVVWVSV